VIPYADFTYFGLLLYLIVPTVALGLLGRPMRAWIVVATLLALTAQYWAPPALGPWTGVREVWLVAGFGLWQWAVALGYGWLRPRATRRGPLAAAVLLALLPLALAKLLPALAPGSPVGFLGISYLTFRSLDVILGLKDGVIGTLTPAQYVAYLFFFPTVSAGPIDRYRRFALDWKHDRSRAEFLQDLDGAVRRLFTGFLYSFILAALTRRYWLEPAAATPGLLGSLSYMYAYSIYLFFDFAGYSAFAIGVSYLFGVHPPENFRRPFLARDIRDFWNRWHISLSAWLRDQVYMRFVLAATRGRWFTDKHSASYAGLALTFGLMGLWHGVEAHYLLYGLYHAGLLIGHDLFARWNQRRRLWGEGRLWQAAGIALTFNLVCFGFLLFSGHLTRAAADRPAGVTISPGVVVFAPVEDAYAAEATPTTNYGIAAALRVDWGDQATEETYLRFTVTGLDGPIERARLRLYAESATVDGAAVYRAGDGWSEKRLTWSNRPGRSGAALDQAAGHPAAVWVEYDVTAAVTGNGTFSFVLATPSTDGITFSSREGGQPPQLIIATRPAP
jgi:membrane protein involved in D-alanine export